MGANAEQSSLSFEGVVEVLSGAPDIAVLRDGKKVEVQRVKMRHIGALTALVSRVVDVLGVDDRGDVSIDLGNRKILLQLISKIPEEVEVAVLLLTNLSAEEYAALDVADGLAVLEAVIRVNRSFFTEEVLPRFTSVVAAISLTGSEVKSQEPASQPT